MEVWEFDFEWLQTRHKIKALLSVEKLPDLQSILLLIGVQELGQIKEEFTKEEKQDLIHIATCRLLSYDGYYEFEGLDADGWPHWRLIESLPYQGVKEQEKYLKLKVIQYIEEISKGS